MLNKKSISLALLFTLTMLIVACSSQEYTTAKLAIQQSDFVKAAEWLPKAMAVEPDNPDLLSESILELINDEKKCERLGISGYQTVLKTCNSKNMVKNILTVYEQLIKEKSKSGIM